MLSDEKAAATEHCGYNGLGFMNEYERQYPHGSLAAHVMGFAGLDNKGLEGLEYRFNGQSDTVMVIRPAFCLNDTCRLAIILFLTLKGDAICRRKGLVSQIEANVAGRGRWLCLGFDGRILPWQYIPHMIQQIRQCARYRSHLLFTGGCI
jgi:hypothetical protein